MSEKLIKELERLHTLYKDGAISDALPPQTGPVLELVL